MAEQKWSEPSRVMLARAAEELFLAKGYAGTTVRAVAAAADLDPSLVIRHFGTKEGLFLTVVRFDDTFAEEIDGPIEGIGERLVRRVVSGDRENRFQVHAALARASDNEAIRDRLREVVEDVYVIPLARRLQGPRRELRARLVAVQLIGLLDTLSMLQDVQLAGLEPDDLARLYGPALQALIDTPQDTAGSTGT